MEGQTDEMMSKPRHRRTTRWSNYRNCTSFTSLCNLVFGLLLISLWAACYQRCLSRLDAENDAAAPLWTGIICVVVGSFGLIASCLYWRRKNETLLFGMTLVAALCSVAALTLSVYASFKEFQLYESQGRPLDVFDYGILGVVLFASMAVLCFMVFLGSLTWACTCAFKRYRATASGGKMYEGDDHLNVIEVDEEPTPAFVRDVPRTSLPRASRQAPAVVHPLHIPTSYDRHPPDMSAIPAQASFNLPKFSSWDSPRRNAPKQSAVGPRFASVTAAERQWWRSYSPPQEDRARRIEQRKLKEAESS